MARTTPVNSGYTIINGTTTGSNGSKVDTWIEWKITGQSVTNNTSTVRVVLYSAATFSSSTSYSGTANYGYVTYDNGTKQWLSISGYDFSNYQVNKFADYTFTIPHNSDGTKTVTLQGSWSTSHSSYISGGNVSGQVTLTRIARASSISNLTTKLGTAGTITITRQSNDFTHTLTYSFGSSTGTIATKTTNTSVSWTPPVSLINQFGANEKTKTGTLTCETFSGNTSVGTSTSTLTINIPNSSINNITGRYGTAVTITAYNSCTSGLSYTFAYEYGGTWHTIGTTTTKEISWTLATDRIGSVENANFGDLPIRVRTYRGTTLINEATAMASMSIPPNTSSAVSGTIGSSLTISISKAHSKLTSTIRYNFGSVTGTIATKTTSTSQNWTPPTSLLTEIPNSASGTGVIYIDTYNGTASCGTLSYVLTLSAASSVVPTSSLTLGLVNNNPVVNGWGLYVQGYSQVRATLTANGISGSTISNMSVNGLGLNATSSPQTSSGTLTGTSAVLTTSGSQRYTGNASDSRSRSATTKTQDINIYPYSAPSLTGITLARANSEGTIDAGGTYLKVVFTQNYSSVNGNNSATTSLKYRIRGASSWTSYGAVTSGANLNLNLDVANNYEAQLIISDALNSNIASATISIPSAERIINVNPSGAGLAIGGFSTDAGMFQEYYPARFGDTAEFNDSVDFAEAPTINENFFPNEIGSYGLWNQEILPTTCDLNDYKTAGNYYVNTQTGFTISNKPTECTGAFNLIVERYVNVGTKTAETAWTGVFQTIKHYDGKIWFRYIMKNDSTWTYGSWDSLSPTMGTGILSDFNNYITNGNYWINPNTTTTNRPMNTYGVLSVFRPSTNLIKQEFSAYNTGRTWVRTYTNSQWYDWKELITGTKNNTYSDVELNAPIRGTMIMLNAKTYTVTGNLNDNWKDFLKAVCDDFISGSYPTGSYILNLSWQSVTWGQGIIFVNGTAYVMVKWFLPNQGYMSGQLWNGTYVYSWIPGSAANVIKDVDVSSFSKTSGTTQTIASISLPAGRYLIEGYASPSATASAQKFEIWFSAATIHREGIWSGASGIVYMNIHSVINITSTQTINFSMYSSAAVTVTNIRIRATALNWT